MTRPRAATRAASRGRDPRRFDHLPAFYDRYTHLVGGPVRDWVSDRLPVYAGRAVDLGCGTGHLTALLAEHVRDVLAVDVSTPMISYANRHHPAANVEYLVRDLGDVTPGRDGTFDLVLSTYTLHHVTDLRLTLHQIRSLIRPGGTVLLVDICDDEPRDRDWFTRDARRTLTADLRYRRRSIREAWQTYRLSVQPDWLDHQTSDHALTPTEFAHHYGAVFPDPEITEFHRARGLHWHHPWHPTDQTTHTQTQTPMVNDHRPAAEPR